jgi:lysophospholipase L1-like esterase
VNQPAKERAMAALPRLLLLGDSIRMSYQPLVAERLRGRADVVGPADNCQFALYTLSSLGRWLGELGAPDVVHWNNGIHDCGHNPNRAPAQIPLADYLGNLRFILAALRAATPRVVWATMTPQHPQRPFRVDQWSWRNEEMARYNAAAESLMRSEGVPVNDLGALVLRQPEELLAEDQLHLSASGQAACAAAVVRTLEAEGYLPG